LRQANFSNSTDILIHVGTDEAELTKTSLEMFLSLVWLHINKWFCSQGVIGEQGTHCETVALARDVWLWVLGTSQRLKPNFNFVSSFGT